MTINPIDKDLLRRKFAEMQTKEDLSALLSSAKEILYGKECNPVQLKHITYYANPQNTRWRYSKFKIKKKSGGERIIHAPVVGLKSILRPLNLVLHCIYEPSQVVTGFVPNRSIVDNARIHAGNHYVYNIDLKDFFHSFDRNRVKMGFMQDPFNLNGDREPLAFLLASLCTHLLTIEEEDKIVLPQGSPTSPTITNILCRKLDRRLMGLAKRFGIKYSRYADDITFSSPHNIYNKKEFLKELHRIIEEDQGFKINPSKTRLQSSGYRQETTGLVINEKPNVHRRYIKQIRMWLYFWEKYGYSKAQKLFMKDYDQDRGHVKVVLPNLISVVDGKLEFLRMVKGENDGTYLKLKARYEELCGMESDLNHILSSWEKEGIEVAMKLYNEILLRS